MNKLLNVRKQVCNMTDGEKEKFVKMIGSIILWEDEARSIKYMSDKLNLEPWAIDENIDEILYILRKRVGIWHYLRILFMH